APTLNLHADGNASSGGAQTRGQRDHFVTGRALVDPGGPDHSRTRPHVSADERSCDEQGREGPPGHRARRRVRGSTRPHRVGRLTRTDTSPCFVRMKEGAQQAADAAGGELQTFAGRQDGDNESQVQAMETLISAGAAGFLITPNDSAAIVPTLDRARQQGLY